LNSRSKYFS